jgi:toxin CcdB
MSSGTACRSRSTVRSSVPRFHAYRDPDRDDGWLLDVQADLLSHLGTTGVVPLLPEDAPDTPRPAHDLNPVVEIEGRRYVVMTQWISAVPKSLLRGGGVSLDHLWDDLSRAINVLFQGV